MFKRVQYEAIHNVKDVASPKFIVTPEDFDKTCDHKTIVRDRQPNQQPIKNIVQMWVPITKNIKKGVLFLKLGVL